MLVESDPLAEAIETLRIKGHVVEPRGADLMRWLVDNREEELSERQLIALALRLGLVDGPGRAQ